MKTISFCRKLFFTISAASLLPVLMLFTACSKGYSGSNGGGGGNTQMYTTNGNASGAQENPPVSSSGTGSLTGTYNASTNNWQYNINWSSLSDVATAIELHGPADVGVNGDLMLALTITTSGANGTASGNASLTEQQEANLLAGKCYYTILTATHITGEVRGQIMAAAQY